MHKIDSFQAGEESKSGGSKVCRHWTCPGYPAMVKSVFEIGSQWWRRLSGGFIWAFLRRECIKKSRKNGIFFKFGVVEENVRKGLLCVLEAEVDLEKVKKRHFFKDWSGGVGPYRRAFCAVCRRELVPKSRKNGIFLKFGVVEEVASKGLLCGLQAGVGPEKVKKRHFFKDWSG